MKTKTVSGLQLFYEPGEEEAALLVETACERSVQLIRECWGLAAPRDCRVYVMTSWDGFLFHSTPLEWKPFLVLAFPLLGWRFNAIWPYVGGYAYQIGNRRIVGIKPPRLLQSADSSLGEQLYLQNRTITEKVQTVACHELVHACTSHLKLPAWLNEGLATLAMEHYLERRIVREDTLDKIVGGPRELKVEKPQALISLYTRGYWLTCYIEETRPELLKELLARRISRRELEEKIAAAYGKEHDQFWKEIESNLKKYFGQLGREGTIANYSQF